MVEDPLEEGLRVTELTVRKVIDHVDRLVRPMQSAATADCSDVWW